MSEQQPLFRWLDQQGEAFGSPGSEPRWTSSVKDAVGTAYAASSRIWFTCSHGVLNEVYHPTIDRAQVRDMEFLVTDGETFVHEEKRDLVSTFEYIHPEALGVRYVNRDRDGRYSLTKEIVCDPHHSVVLVSVQDRRRSRVAAAAEGVCAAGAASGWGRGRQLGEGGGYCRAESADGVEGRVVAGDGGQLRVFAGELRVCRRKRRLAGPDGPFANGVGVWVGDGRKHRGDGRDRHALRGSGGAERCSGRGRRGIRVHGGIRDRRGAPHSGAEDDWGAGDAVCGG